MIVNLSENQTLWSVLADKEIDIARPCGGNGSCGMCQVLVEGIGLVKSCCFDTPGRYNVIIPEQNEASFESLMVSHIKGEFRKQEGWDHKPLAVIDVGTTTVAVRIYNRGNCFQKGFVNPQRKYGADVMSRIRRANEGDAQVMSQLLWKELEKMGINEEFQGKVIVSANTTMQHIMRGLSCQGLGQAPFTPVDISLAQIDLENGSQITYMPGISTYVGADIVSGLYSLDVMRRDKPIMLIDLGTNGEMAIGCRDGILVTSTAAGPAFEGSDLAMRIHASGIMKLLRELLDKKVIDSYGTLKEEYFDTGYPTAAGMNITQDNIREIQMAKAAIRAGIQILLDRYGISPQELDRIYLAGGMGYYLEPDDAVAIGLLPPEILKVEAVGNTSLAGAEKLAMTGDSQELLQIVEASQEIILANQPEFQDLYIEYMNF